MKFDNIHDLVTHYRDGLLWAYVCDRARIEARLDTSLDEAEQMQVQGLLQGVDDDQFNASVESIGADQAFTLLRRVLHFPGRFHGGQEHVYPLLEYQGDNVRWLLEELEIGVTAFRMHVSVWTSIPDGVEVPTGVHGITAEKQLEAWDFLSWDGFLRVTDDIGTEYQPVGTSTSFRGPVRVACRGAHVNRLSLRHTARFGPGPPSEAKVLRLMEALPIRLMEFEGDSNLGSARTVPLDDLDCEIDLPYLDPLVRAQVAVRAPTAQWPRLPSHRG